MRIALADWLLEVNVPLTMDLSVGQAQEHCDCGYCRNYYAGLDRACPSLRPFLAQFGLDAEGPDELCPFEPTIYEATYIVQGQIIHHGQEQLYIDQIPLRIYPAKDADMCTEHPDPYFVLRIGLMELPWSLDEPMDQVVSPANEEAYLQRMQDKLLKLLDTEQITS